MMGESDKSASHLNAFGVVDESRRFGSESLSAGLAAEASTCISSMLKS